MSLFLTLAAISCGGADEPVSMFGDLSGRVTDFDSGEPISKALVTIGGASSVTTGSDGYYIINDVDPGTYSVSVSAESYISSTRSVIVKANYNTQCDFAVYATKGTISVSPMSADFGMNLPAIQLTVKNTGRKALNISSIARSPWISVSPSHFNLPTGTETSVSVTVDRSAFGFADNYSSSVEFSFDNSTFPVPVNCTASDEQVNGSIVSSASELIFTKNDISKSFTITNNGKTPVSYQIAPAANCSKWVSSVAPTYGTMGVNASQEISLFIDRAKIVESGIVSGEMIVTYASNVKQFSVLLHVDAGDAVKPEVSPAQVTLSAYNAATVTGDLVSVGSHPVLDYGICFSKSAAPALEDEDSKVISLGNSATAAHICKSISNLESNKTYYFRIYARNAVGTSYSNVSSVVVPANTGDISGTVTNSVTKVPISQALVEAAGIRTYTNDNGEYSLPAVPTGAYEIFASAKSYNAAKDLVSVSYASRTVLNFELEPAIPGIDISPSSLDFGADCDVLSFNIENKGATVINFDISTAAEWVGSIIPASGKLGVGGNSDVKIFVNREVISEKGKFDSVVRIISEAGENFVGISIMSGVLTPPTVNLDKIVKVYYSSVIAEMSVVKIGSNIVSEFGICISKSPSPTIDDIVVSKTGMFSIPSNAQFEAKGLEPNTQYYIKAYAKSVAGVSYSSKTLSFKTNATNNEDVDGDGNGTDFHDNQW